MRSESKGRSGRQPMTDKRFEYVRLIRMGVSNSEACRRLGIDRKTGHWWKNGGSVTRNGVTRVVEAIVDHHLVPVESGRYLTESERVTIADGVRDGRSARSIAAELGRAVSTVSRELQRNTSADGRYRPHAAHAMMRSRRPRPKQRLLERDEELRRLVQHYLDQRWSPEQVVHELGVAHGRHLGVETIYQALYSPYRVIGRQAANVLRTGRPYRRPRIRGDQRRPRFVVPITMIDERPPEADDRSVPGHWEGDLIVGAFNRSAIGTLVERVTRFTILVHLAGESRSDTLPRSTRGHLRRAPARTTQITDLGPGLRDVPPSLDCRRYSDAGVLLPQGSTLATTEQRTHQRTSAKLLSQGDRSERAQHR